MYINGNIHIYINLMPADAKNFPHPPTWAGCTFCPTSRHLLCYQRGEKRTEDTSASRAPLPGEALPSQGCQWPFCRWDLLSSMRSDCCNHKGRAWVSVNSTRWAVACQVTAVPSAKEQCEGHTGACATKASWLLGNRSCSVLVWTLQLPAGSL